MGTACYTDVGISCENVGYYPIGDISFDMVSLGVPFSCSKLLIDSDLTVKRFGLEKMILSLGVTLLLNILRSWPFIVNMWKYRTT